MMLRLVGLIVVLIVAVTAGTAVWEAQDDELKEAAREAAVQACDERLPGDGWTVANETIDPGAGLQSVACSRDGVVRNVSVQIEVELSS